MTIIGRLTKNASVNTLRDGRKVMNFSLAINEYYKPKGKTEGIRLTTFINCSYWIGTVVAKQLQKGALVEITGRIYTTAFLVGTEPRASLNCHVAGIKIHQFSKETLGEISKEIKAKAEGEPLPF